MNRFSDSHCHLNRCNADFDAIKNANVGTLLAIMCHFGEHDDILDKVKQARTHGLDAGMSIGIHPCQSESELWSADVDTICAHNHDLVWAVGESGLDYYHDASKKQAQAHSFLVHIKASQILQKPLVVHTRNAIDDTLAILQDGQCTHGIMHCFSEDWQSAKTALDMGLYLSFSGVLTFKNAQSLRDIAQKAPRERILIETDSPYLAPVPHRGKPNTPAFVPLVGQTLAKIWNISDDECARITTQNFYNLLKGV